MKKKDVELGISDGVNVEILKGISEADEVKIWNKAKEKRKKIKGAKKKNNLSN
ncbi:MAG: hypothetical protein U5K51_15545 [Flavobacteriaceae bacterium]|nr:hypothetical protein [Flavobacteriaceae bacterium]